MRPYFASIQREASPFGFWVSIRAVLASVALVLWGLFPGIGLAEVAGQEDAGRRIALVIGNGNYAGVGALANPVNDAQDIAQKLRQLGFAVTLHTDADYLVMRRALTEFGRQVKEGTVALFFYAGHGMQVRGKNYLLPVDARIQIENDVGTEAMDVDFLLDKLNQARLSLVILDACRNNPFEKRFRSGSGAGLAHMSAPTGTLIAYSTAPGKVAADGEGRNGLYTGELLKAMSIPGLQVEEIFKRVRSSVVKLSGETQTPWEASSLTGNFYFAGASTASPMQRQPAAVEPTMPTVLVPPAAMPQAKVSAAVPVASAGVGEDGAWAEAKRTNTIDAYASYVKAYPLGKFLDEAKARSAILRQGAAARQLGKVFKDCEDCPEMVFLPGGRYEMGSSHGGASELPVHNVDIRYSFALGRTEVTQGQWKAVMGTNPSRFAECGESCPVENVSWDDVQIFLQKLSAKTGKAYRLPTEAEWEFAARARTTSRFSWGDNVGAGEANCDGCGSRWDNRSTAPVGSFQPNSFGLYDMLGNVSEWVADCWAESFDGVPVDGSAWLYDGCTERVSRGGSWNQDPRFIRSAARIWGAAGKRVDTRGFRLARTL